MANPKLETLKTVHVSWHGGPLRRRLQTKMSQKCLIIKTWTSQHHCLQLCRKSRRNFWEISSRSSNNWWTDPPIQISIRITTHWMMKHSLSFLYWSHQEISHLAFKWWSMLPTEMCFRLGDTWPEASTTLPEDSVWSIMMEVVLACWNLCRLRRVIELWNDVNHQEDLWILITLCTVHLFPNR